MGEREYLIGDSRVKDLNQATTTGSVNGQEGTGGVSGPDSFKTGRGFRFGSVYIGPGSDEISYREYSGLLEKIKLHQS